MANSAVVGALRVLLSADTAQFEKALKGADANVQKLANTMKRDLEPSQARINSLVRSFLGSKEIGLANTYAKAIEQIGSASRLTAGDQVRANKAFQEAIEHLKKLGPEAEKDIKKFEGLAYVTRQVASATNQASPALGALNTQWLKLTSAFTAGALLEKGIQGVADGFRLVATFVEESIQEFIEADQIQRKVTAALQAQGTAIPVVVAQFEALANKYKELTVNSDEAIKETEALLVQVGGVLPSEMDKALDAVTNLSAGLGIDLRSAALMVSKSFEDNFGALKKAGIAIDETRAKSEGMSYVLGKIQERFGGQAQAEVASYAGQIKQLGNQFDDLKEDIGKTFADSGILNVGLGLAKVGVHLLSLEFIHLISIINTMPSLKDLAPAGIVGAMPAWLKRQNEEFDRMVKSMEASRSSAAAGTGITKEEFWAGLSREQEEQHAKDMAARAAAAKKAAEELKQYRQRVDEIKASILGLSKGEREQLQAEKELAHEGHIAQVAALLSVENQLDKVTSKSLIHASSMALVADSYIEAAQRVQSFYQLVGAMSLKSLFPSPISSEQLQGLVKVPGATFGQNFSSAIAMSPEVILRALTGGGNVGKSIGGLFGGTLAQGAGAKIAKQLQGSFLGKSLGGAIGGAIPGIASLGMSSILSSGGGSGMLSNIGSFASAGMMFGPWGAAIGAGIGAIVGAFKKGANETKKSREEFAKSLGLGSTDELYKKLQSMGAEGAKLANVGLNVIGKHDQAANQKWMKDVTAFFDRLERVPGKVNELSQALGKFGGAIPKQLAPLLDSILANPMLSPELRKQLEGMRKPAWQAAQEMADAFGVDKGALGAGFNQARLGDRAFELKRALDVFAAFEGYDQKAVLRDMADEFSDLARESRRTGVALPKAVQEFIRQVDEMNLLLDENGNRIDSSLLKFADIEDEYQKQVVSLLEQIRDLLTPPAPPSVPGLPPGATPRTPPTPPVINPGDFNALTMPDYGSLSMSAYSGMPSDVASLSADSGGGTANLYIDSRLLASVLVPALPGATKRYAVGR